MSNTQTKLPKAVAAWIDTLLESTLHPYNYLDKELQEAGEGIRVDNNGLPFWCRSTIWMAREFYNEFAFTGAHDQLTKIETAMQAAEVVANKDGTDLPTAYRDMHRASAYRPDTYDFAVEERGKYQTQVEMLGALRSHIEDKFKDMTGLELTQFLTQRGKVTPTQAPAMTAAETKLAEIKARMAKKNAA